MPAAYRMLIGSTPEQVEQRVNAYLASRKAARLVTLDVNVVEDVETREDVFVVSVTTDDAEAHTLAQPYSVRILVSGSPQEAADAFNAFADANPNVWIGEQKLRVAQYRYEREGLQRGYVAAFAFHPVAADGARNWRAVPKAPAQPGGGGAAPKATGPKP